MERCYILLRTLCREMSDRTLGLPPDQETQAYGPPARTALADVLDCAADAMNGVADLAVAAGPVETARARVQDHLADLHRRRDRLNRLLLVDAHAGAAERQQHGAVLVTVDRLRVEIETAIRPASEPWRPPLLAERPRLAVRRVIDTATEDALPLITERPRQAVRRAINATAEAATSAAAAAEAGAHAAAGELRALRRRSTDTAPATATPNTTDAAPPKLR